MYGLIISSEYDIDDSTEEDDYLPDFLGHKKKRKCNHSNMKCVTHTNEHWKTPPYWNGNLFLLFLFLQSLTYGFALLYNDQLHDKTSRLRVFTVHPLGS